MMQLQMRLQVAVVFLTKHRRYQFRMLLLLKVNAVAFMPQVMRVGDFCTNDYSGEHCNFEVYVSGL